MTVNAPTRRRIVLLALGFVLALLPPQQQAVAQEMPISVAQALGVAAGTDVTVRGYVVGQPVETHRVVTTGFSNDYALAIADSAGETDTADMLYVQLPAALRSSYGLRSNPSLLGDRIDVAATLEAYFAHDGLKSVTAITGSGADPDPDPGAPGDYYAGTEGLQGAALEQSLQDIVSEQTRLSYTQVWDALKETDEDPADPSRVILLYTGRSQSESEHGGGADDWNREHVWPQSHGGFGTATGPGTDLHHLRPADVGVNADRGNLDFDNGGTETPTPPATSVTPTPGNRATRSRATSRG